MFLKIRQRRVRVESLRHLLSLFLRDQNFSFSICNYRVLPKPATKEYGKGK
nr:hypothetical protein [Tanacetum cinerariifolium]